LTKRDCPCEYCECTMTSSIFLIDPCPLCLGSHEEYNDYQEGIGIKENKEWGNIPETVTRNCFGGK